MIEEKSFNTFVFLSTLARSLVECFIPVILYNKGLPIKYILLYLLLNYSLCFILDMPLGYLSKKITFKWTMMSSSFLMGIAYYFLLVTDINVVNILVFAILHVINTHVYWLARHYYASLVLPKKDMADEVGNIIIFSTLAIIPISYIGAWLMNNFDKLFVLTIIVLVYVTSTLPLFKIKEPKRMLSVDLRTSIKKIVSDVPKKSIWFMIFAQFRMISRYLFPLYLYIYVKRNFEYIGLFNITVGIASMIFVYFFARKMDKDKKDYLIISGILGCIVYLFKLNITNTIFMLVIGFFEGLVDKMYEVAFNRNLYALGHHYNVAGYTVFMEGFQNFWRTVIMIIFVLFSFDLKTILYISSFMLIIAGMIGFDDGKGGY